RAIAAGEPCRPPEPGRDAARRVDLELVRRLIPAASPGARLDDRTALEILNDLLRLMACHAAVRAGDRLTPEEIAALVRRRGLAAHSHPCPHGRPPSLLFTLRDLERQFRRV